MFLNERNKKKEEKEGECVCVCGWVREREKEKGREIKERIKLIFEALRVAACIIRNN